MRPRSPNRRWRAVSGFAVADRHGNASSARTVMVHVVCVSDRLVGHAADLGAVAAGQLPCLAVTAGLGTGVLAGDKRRERLDRSLLRTGNGTSDGAVDEGADRPEPQHIAD